MEKVKSLVGNGSRWSLTGIAYEDIEVSDVVLAETEIGQIPLVVVSIRSERQDVSTLKRTRTGDMVVTGRIGDDIHGLKYVLKGERVQP